MLTNYLITGAQYLKAGFLIGIPVYLIVALLRYALKKRKSISWNCVFEMMFCIYSITLLKITGVFTLTYNINGMFSYNLIPFVGSSIVPVFLNFLLFLPYGFLLPLVFRSCRWNWKKIIMTGGFTSCIIELLQMFGGRYAEIDDLLMNTFGAFSGFLLYSCICERKKNRKKAITSVALLCLSLILCFVGIYCIGNNEKPLPDGLEAVENYIAEVHVYFHGEKQTIEADFEAYLCFANQLSNCGGHLLETETISENRIWNNDCFIEIIYDSPQHIRFENADYFTIENADRLLYNADQNTLYWGNSEYQNCLDYTKMGEALQAHQEEILEQYKRLPVLISRCFE